MKMADLIIRLGEHWEVRNLIVNYNPVSLEKWRNMNHAVMCSGLVVVEFRQNEGNIRIYSNTNQESAYTYYRQCLESGGWYRHHPMIVVNFTTDKLIRIVTPEHTGFVEQFNKIARTLTNPKDRELAKEMHQKMECIFCQYDSNMAESILSQMNL